MAESSDASKPLVLIVEDDPILSMDLAEILAEWNYVVCGVAGNAAKAMELAAHHKPHLALVDVGLRGDMDGIDLAVRLRLEHSVPSIIVSGALSSDLAARAEAARPAGFLAKPYMPWELEKVLAEAWPQRVAAAT